MKRHQLEGQAFQDVDFVHGKRLLCNDRRRQYEVNPLWFYMETQQIYWLLPTRLCARLRQGRYL